MKQTPDFHPWPSALSLEHADLVALPVMSLALGHVCLPFIGTCRLGDPSCDVLLPLAHDLLTLHWSVTLLPGLVPVALHACSSLRSESLTSRCHSDSFTLCRGRVLPHHM